MKTPARLLPLLLLAPVLSSALCGQIPLPGYTSAFSVATATRGFFFQTPVTIVINGLRVPDEQKHGKQNVEVFRMTAPPPAYPATGTGTQVFYATGVPSDQVIPCTLVFLPGEYIGVLGGCGDTSIMHSWYGAGNFASNVLGQPITLLRFLTQTNIVTSGGNQPYSSEGTASIARVEVFVSGQSAAINYGAGSTGGGSGVPSLTTTAWPILGTTATLQLSQSNVVNQGGVIALSVGRGSLPLFGGTLWIHPAIALVIPLGASLPTGNTPLNLPIPNSTSVVGAMLDFQGAVVLGPNLALSNATEWQVGY